MKTTTYKSNKNRKRALHLKQSHIFVPHGGVVSNMHVKPIRERDAQPGIMAAALAFATGMFKRGRKS